MAALIKYQIRDIKHDSDNWRSGLHRPAYGSQAAQRHNLLSADQPINTLLPGFELCGLGALHEIAERCDRLVSL